VQHIERISGDSPWRAATFVVGVLAAIELVVLVAIGVVHFAPTSHTTPAARHHVAPVHRTPAAEAPAVPRHPLRARGSVRVLVLNGNGVAGAASDAAQRLEVEGYRIGAATNAPRHDYAQSMVLYVPGWVKEARRLAHDAGVRMVAPIDGMPRSQLKGSKLVLLLGT
jgi:LytR cell envelope-related transcriptional attenuator